MPLSGRVDLKMRAGGTFGLVVCACDNVSNVLSGVRCSFARLPTDMHAITDGVGIIQSNRDFIKVIAIDTAISSASVKCIP